MEKEIRYSFSRLELYEQCPFKYYLKYIEGNYPKAGSIALFFGTLTHETEEAIGNYLKENKPIDYEALKLNYVKKCEELKEKYPEDWVALDKSGRTYEEKANLYITEGIYRFEKFIKANEDIEIVGLEVPFSFTYKGKLFRGAIDRVLRNKTTGKYIVQDIKTYNVAVDKDKLTTPLQFVVYCLALQELYGVDPTTITCQYDLPLCDLVQDAGTKGFITRGSAKLDKLFVGIGDEDWEPKQSALCHWCDYCQSNKSADETTKYLCPYFCHWTKENKTFMKENEWAGMKNHNAIVEAYHWMYGIKKDK